MIRNILILFATTIPALLASTVADGGAEAMLIRVQKQIQSEPGNPRLLATEGALLAGLGRDAESLHSFDRALAVSPKFLLALEGAAEVSYRSNDPRTDGYIDRIFVQDPNNLVAHGMAGAVAFAKGDCKQTISHFEKGGAAVTENPVALEQWGVCLIQTDQPAAAAQRLEQSLRLQPADVATRMNLAMALQAGGDSGAALETLKPLPETPPVLNLRGVLLASRQQFDSAIAVYRKAIQLDPKQESSYVNLASLCLDHQSLDVATDVVNVGLAALPQSAGLYTMRGAIEAQYSDMDKATADFETARRLQPDQVFSDAGLSLLLEQQSQIDDAIRVVRSRLQSAPRVAQLHFLMADLLLRRQDVSPAQEREAKEHLTTAIRMNPSLPKAHSLLGKLLLHEAQTAAAVDQLQLALKFDPNDRIALNQLVIAYRKLGREADAHETALRLQKSLADARRTEVQKNSVHFVRITNPNQTPAQSR